MDISTIAFSILSVGALGVICGVGLSYAGKKLSVESDPRVDAVLECLPGANCGGCGYPGCAGCATAIVAGKAPVNACPVGGAAVAAKVAAVMGVEASTSERKAAFVHCGGTCEKAKTKYDYQGITDCTMASQLAGGGPKSCSYGCLGLGNCKAACAFDAIEIVDGIAVVDQDKCVTCGKCVSACPKHLIELLPVKKKVKVKCNSHDKGKDVMAVCSAGCIACKLCEKECKFDAIHVIDNIAVIDYDKCVNCGMCANKCPKKVITGYRVAPPAPPKPAEAPAAVEAPKEEAAKVEAPKA